MEFHIEIKLDGDGFPSVDVLSFRNLLEDEIEDRGIGAVTGTGAGMGAMDVWVELADAKRNLPAIHELLKELQIEDIATIRPVRRVREVRK